MSKNLKYLNNASLKNLCEKGSDEDIKEYIEFYTELRSNLTDTIDRLDSGLSKFKISEDLEEVLNDENLSSEEKEVLIDILTDSKQLKVLLKGKGEKINRLGWYDKVLNDLNEAL